MATKKEDDGLRFRNIKDFNLALLAKQLWRLITIPNLLISKEMKARYFLTGGLSRFEVKNRHLGCGKVG